ncbi:MAG: tetratricopeptide repeat protein [Candidatus Aminicenantes bacterium]|nr:MAG: tetratricopeptide repeat protein [Candidatus Aminicenantes bacterium]
MDIKKFSRLLFIASISFLLVNYAIAQAGRGKGRMAGVVVNEDGNSIGSAKIVIEFSENMKLKQETATNKKGEWAIMGLGTGTWRVTASADGYIPTSRDVYIRQLERNPKITLTLKKIPPSDKGTIKDESSLNLIEEANRLFTEKKYDESVVLLEQFLEKNPGVYQTCLNIGDCYREKGEVDKAVEEYNKVLEEAKKDDVMGKEMAAKALAAIGDCYLKKGNFEAAADYFKQSIESYSDNEILAYNVGEIYFSNQKIDEAIHYFDLSTQIKPDWGPPYLKLGYSYLNKGEYEKAKLNLNKFLELDPESPEAPKIKDLIDYLEKIKK